MPRLTDIGTPANSFASMAFVEAILRVLVAKGVMSEDEVSAMFNEVADVLSKQSKAIAQEAGATVRRAKL